MFNALYIVPGGKALLLSYTQIKPMKHPRNG